MTECDNTCSPLCNESEIKSLQKEMYEIAVSLGAGTMSWTVGCAAGWQCVYLVARWLVTGWNGTMDTESRVSSLWATHHSGRESVCASGKQAMGTNQYRVAQ